MSDQELSRRKERLYNMDSREFVLYSLNSLHAAAWWELERLAILEVVEELGTDSETTERLKNL